ncbi:hypothetical protein HRbin33_00410 [bacterium HR33]|nr:hypothetical protein HRbin33_00410 [bacterium HR33]
MLRATSLLALGLMMWLFKGLAAGASPQAAATLALGFLLLAAYLGGLLVRRLSLPKITGYLLVGVLAGPAGLHFVTSHDIDQLRLVGEIAVALIALAAGGEIRLPELKRYRSLLLKFGGAAIAFPMAIVIFGAILTSPWFPLTAGRPLTDVVAISLLLGVIAAAGSPAVALAVISETGARGPLARAVLTVVVAKDVTVIVAFAVALSLGRALVSDAGLDLEFVLAVGRRIAFSIMAGWALGWLASQYLKYVEREMVLFTLGTAFLAVELAHMLQLEAMLLTLTAGFFVENIAPVRGERFVRAIEQSSLPVYAVFFALGGAGVHIEALREMWLWAALLIGLRAVGVLAAARWGAKEEPVVARYGWCGLISQAGVALGLALMTRSVFPAWGAALETLAVAMIAVHELIGPVLLRWGLSRAGEVEAEREPQPEERLLAKSGVSV